MSAPTLLPLLRTHDLVDIAVATSYMRTMLQSHIMNSTVLPARRPESPIWGPARLRVPNTNHLRIRTIGTRTLHVYKAAEQRHKLFVATCFLPESPIWGPARLRVPNTNRLRFRTFGTRVPKLGTGPVSSPKHESLPLSDIGDSHPIRHLYYYKELMMVCSPPPRTPTLYWGPVSLTGLV